MSTENHQDVTIQISIPDGVANGVWVVDRGLDWNGSVVVCPRACFETARSMKQFDQPGVYILRRQADEDDKTVMTLPKIYIGLADPIKDRLNNHYANKDFWNEVFVCVGDSGGRLNKAHIEHLESRLISMAQSANRCDLENGNTPKLPTLSKSEVASVENFMTKLLFVLRVLGLKVFEKPIIPQTSSSANETPSGVLFLNSKGVTAKGCLVASGFVVLAKSQIALQLAAHASERIIESRNSLKAKGVLIAENDRLIFSQDYEFSSPSTAAQVVLGCSANGRIVWKNEEGKTLKELETAAVGLTGT